MGCLLESQDIFAILLHDVRKSQVAELIFPTANVIETMTASNDAKENGVFLLLDFFLGECCRLVVGVIVQNHVVVKYALF